MKMKMQNVRLVSRVTTFRNAAKVQFEPNTDMFANAETGQLWAEICHLPSGANV